MLQSDHTSALRACIRDIPDFPKPGVVFKDITPLLQSGDAFNLAVTLLLAEVKDLAIGHVLAVESRGFIFGSALAFALKAGLVIVRKPKKLPYQTRRVDYGLEYGTDALEMHVDALAPRDRVLIVDDILATGGTALAATQLVEQAGAHVEAIAFLSELSFLKGREKLKDFRLISLLSL